MLPSMKKLYIYLYYRSYQIYKGSQRSDGPLVFFMSLNIAFVVNVFCRLLAAGGLNFKVEWLFFVDLSIVILFPFVKLFIPHRAMLKYIGKTMESFKSEAPDQRSINGLLLFLYMIVSFALVVISILW